MKTKEVLQANEHWRKGAETTIADIPAQATIVIWSGGNAHEHVGLRYAAYLLRHCHNRIFIFNADEACGKRFNTADHRIDYLHTGEIPNEKLLAVYGEAEANGPLTCETRQALEREWLNLAEDHEVLRIWKGEKILSADEQYFDAYLSAIGEKTPSSVGRG